MTLHAQAGEDYARQLTAEVLVKDQAGKAKWVRKRKDNHLLDCTMMSHACVDGSWLPSLAQMIEFERERQAAVNEVEAQLRRQFPGVDYDATIARIREYLERTGKPVRNALRYLTACFGNAAGPAASAPVAVPPISRPSSAPEPRRAPEKAVPFSFDPKKPLPVPGATPEAFRLATPGELRVSFAQGIEKIHLLREAIRPRDAAKECTA